jgi:hypothetical protein
VKAGPDTPGREGAGWEEACRREEEIRRLVAEKRSSGIGRAAVGEAAAKLGISVPSLYRLIQRFREDRRVSVLLPRKAGRPVGTRYISEATSRARPIYPPESPEGDGGVEIRHRRCLKVDRGGQAVSNRSLRDIAASRTARLMSLAVRSLLVIDAVDERKAHSQPAQS